MFKKKIRVIRAIRVRLIPGGTIISSLSYKISSISRNPKMTFQIVVPLYCETKKSAQR